MWYYTKIFFSGTNAERGIDAWNNKANGDSSDLKQKLSVYDLPLVQKYLNKLSWSQYLPFCPTFDTSIYSCSCKRKQSKYVEESNPTFQEDAAVTANTTQL